jgi:hypothetical protein
LFEPGGFKPLSEPPAAASKLLQANYWVPGGVTPGDTPPKRVAASGGVVQRGLIRDPVAAAPKPHAQMWLLWWQPLLLQLCLRLGGAVAACSLRGRGQTLVEGFD